MTDQLIGFQPEIIEIIINLPSNQIFFVLGYFIISLEIFLTFIK